MPKAINPSFPLDGLFGLIKPSGPTSMILLDRLKPLFYESSLFVPDEVERQQHIEARLKGKNLKTSRSKGKGYKYPIKVGQGGTLDPLADGVLVIGINKGTKSLASFLNCTKEYYTTALLGCETNTYDSEGSIVQTAPFSHVTREKVEAALGAFRGTISQLPPIYSALKMDGKPLYEYARKGIPLPRPIDARQVTVHSLELVDWQEAASPDNSSSGRSGGKLPEGTVVPGHKYKWPERKLDAEQIAAIKDVKKLIEQASAKSTPSYIDSTHRPTTPTSSDIDAHPHPADSNISSQPPCFTLKMVVSSGTYVRSVVHDLAHSLGSAAHVVALTRTRQGDFAVGPQYLQSEGRAGPTNETNAEGGDLKRGNCIPWEVFERAIEMHNRRAQGIGGEDIAEGKEEWEKLLLARWNGHSS